MWIGRTDASTPSTAWRAPQFNDSGWEPTPVPVGYSMGEPRTGIEAQLVTVLPPGSAPPTYTTLFLRQSFVLLPGSPIRGLKITVHADDGAIVWLNGVEIGRYNVPAGELGYTTSALFGLEADE